MQRNANQTVLERSLLAIIVSVGGLCILAAMAYVGILGVLWYASFNGNVADQPVVAATTAQSFRNLEEARTYSRGATSLSLATQKQIIVLAPRTSVRYEDAAIGSLLHPVIIVKVRTGPYKGIIVWVRKEDIFFGDYL